MLAKIIQFVKQYQGTLFLGILMLLIALISFNLGRIGANEKGELKITTGANIYSATTGNKAENINTSVTPKITPKPIDLRAVASKNSDKYHFTWCPGAKQIKEENKVWFNTAQEAQTAGYTLAGNCK